MPIKALLKCINKDVHFTPLECSANETTLKNIGNKPRVYNKTW